MNEDEIINKLLNQEMSVLELSDKRCRDILIVLIRKLRRQR